MPDRTCQDQCCSGKKSADAVHVTQTAAGLTNTSYVHYESKSKSISDGSAYTAVQPLTQSGAEERGGKELRPGTRADTALPDELDSL